MALARADVGDATTRATGLHKAPLHPEWKISQTVVIACLEIQERVRGMIEKWQFSVSVCHVGIEESKTRREKGRSQAVRSR